VVLIGSHAARPRTIIAAGGHAPRALSFGAVSATKPTRFPQAAKWAPDGRAGIAEASRNRGSRLP
jgi:hypothetical protein